MSVPSYVRKWFGLPSRIALLLGIGAVSGVGGGQAGATAVDQDQPLTRVPQQSVKTFGEMRVWSDAGRIYLAEAGSEPCELPLGDSAEARHLRQLLERDGALAGAPHVLRHQLILVGGGGQGFHWTPDGRQGSGSSGSANQNNGSANQKNGSANQKTGIAASAGQKS